MNSFDHINRTASLDDLLNTPLHHKQPTSPSPAMNWTRPSHHTSSSISSIASSTRSLGQVWDEQDLELMLHSDDGNISVLSPPHGDLDLDLDFDLDHSSSTGHRSMAPSPSPALSCARAPGFCLFGPGAAPEIEFTADFSGMQIPLSASAIQRHTALMSQSHHFLEPALTLRPLPLSNTAASFSSSLMPISIAPATTMFLPLHHPQQFCNHQGLATSQMPASMSSSFYGSSPMSLSMIEPHQQASAFLAGDLLIASAFSSSSMPGTPANFTAMAACPSNPNYLNSNNNINVNTPEYLSDLSSLAQQQQQQQQLTSTMTLASPPPAVLAMRQRPQPQPLTYHTTTIPHTNRDTLQNSATTTTTFLRPVSATNFATIDHPDDALTEAGSLLPTDAATALQKRRRGRPPLDRMPSISPPLSSSSSSLSQRLPTTTITTTTSTCSTLSRSSSTSSTSSSSTSRTTTTTTTIPSRSRQPSPQNYFIMPPYQHSDKKLDHRSFNSRKILKQAQARQAEAEARAQAQAEAEAGAKAKARECERGEQEKVDNKRSPSPSA